LHLHLIGELISRAFNANAGSLYFPELTFSKVDHDRDFASEINAIGQEFSGSLLLKPGVRYRISFKNEFANNTWVCDEFKISEVKNSVCCNCLGINEKDGIVDSFKPRQTVIVRFYNIAIVVDKAVEQLDLLAAGYVCEIVILVINLLHVNEVRTYEIYHQILSGVIDSSHNNRITAYFTSING
jgi:hypothetical protein